MSNSKRAFGRLKVRPGDIIALTYVKEGFTRNPFRVLKLSPSLNYELVTIQAQIHDDEWYSDTAVLLGEVGRQPLSAIGVPLPLIGTEASADPEFFDFGISDTLTSLKDGTAIDGISVAFYFTSETGRELYLFAAR